MLDLVEGLKESIVFNPEGRLLEPSMALIETPNLRKTLWNSDRHS